MIFLPSVLTITILTHPLLLIVILGSFLIQFSSRGDQTQPFSNSKHLKREERNSVSVGHSVCLSHFFFTIIKDDYICEVYSGENLLLQWNGPDLVYTKVRVYQNA